MIDSSQGWGACPTGELTQLASNLAFRRRVKVAMTTAVVAFVLAGAAGAGWLAHSMLGPSAAGPEPVPCGETAPACNDEVAH